MTLTNGIACALSYAVSAERPAHSALDVIGVGMAVWNFLPSTLSAPWHEADTFISLLAVPRIAAASGPVLALIRWMWPRALCSQGTGSPDKPLTDEHFHSQGKCKCYMLHAKW